MKLIVNTLEKLMPLHKTIFLYSDLNFSFFFISIWFCNAVMSDMGVLHYHFLLAFTFTSIWFK